MTANENHENEDLVIHEGDCFGWYSSVASDCVPNSCTQSERCKQYTLVLQKSDKPESLLQELEKFDKKTEPPRAPVPKQAPNHVLLGKAYFDQTVNLVRTSVVHDDINLNSDRMYATLKVKNRAVAFVSQSKQVMRVFIGHPKDTEFTYEFDIGTDFDEVKEKIADLVQRANAC